MSRFDPTRRSFAALALSLAVATAALGPMPAARAQDETEEMPDVATMEARLDAMLEAAVAMPDDEPMHVFQAWGTVFMSAVVLEQRRSLERGGEGASRAEQEQAAEAILQRWERLRPESAGPHLFRAFRIEEQAAKRDAVLAIADRYPDDALALWQATQESRQAGEPGRAVELAEAFVARNPRRGVGYRALAQSVQENETRLAEVLERWAAAVPGDPGLVSRWLASPVASGDTAATRRVLHEFFERKATSQAALDACLEILRRGDPAFADPARACVARAAADPDQPDHVTERATSTLAEMAAAEGDWSSFLDALDTLDPDGRVRLLVATADRLDTPERCPEIVELLSAAAEALGREGIDRWSLTSAMRECSKRPDARALFLDLLRRAPADRVRTALTGWVTKINGVWRGELPSEAAAILEGRLREEGDAEDAGGLFESLDIVYQIHDPEDRRFELLLRWHRTTTSRFDGNRAIDLAWDLVDRGRSAEAIEVLERQLESRFEADVAEALWGLYFEMEGDERAAGFALRLMDADDPWRVATGHLLAARAAFAREDLAAAERHYLQALPRELPQWEVAVELVAVIGTVKGPAELEALADRICREATFQNRTSRPEVCKADLLTQAGRGDAAAGILAMEGRDLPEDLGSLESLAATARNAGQPEIAEAALRRILELDPRSEKSWTDLGVFLEKQGRADEVEALLERSREVFSPPPTFLSRAAGRALTRSDRPERAIDLLLEARAELPEHGGGEWSRGWIDHELREAYRALGETLPPVASADRPLPSPAFGSPEIEAPEGSAEELRILADSLQSGAGGRYDPGTAAALYAKAADMRDPRATFRLALLAQISPERLPAGTGSPEELHRRSVDGVEDLARRGDPYAAYLMGTSALMGLGGRTDFEAARRWLEQAAAEDEPWAWHNLGWMAETGRGLSGPDVTEAVAAYRRASRAGNVVSMVDLARLTLTADASGEPCEEGLEWLERSAGAGNARAAAYLGKLLFYGRGDCVARNPDGARPWLEAGVATHQPGAAYDLGVALLAAGRNDEDRHRGLELLEGAPQPDTLTLETLAFLRAAGLGVRRDPAEARRLIAEAARYGSDGFPGLRREIRASEAMREVFDEGIARLERLAAEGDASAAAFLARIHQTGLAPQSDPAHAVTLAQQAAAAGEASAMRVLMHAYGMGEGVAKDEGESLRWKRRGAEAGDSFCMMFLAHDLLQGERVERDLEAGLAWLHRSAEAGNWWAMSDLGRYYDEGSRGVPRDPEKALYWKRRLADLGDPAARGWLHYREGRSR